MMNCQDLDDLDLDDLADDIDLGADKELMSVTSLCSRVSPPDEPLLSCTQDTE
ncbi:hypothetical protein OK016_27565 [Vibrio chagasii]|nr:hypothetical protein [Vibrio chagasii]